MKNSGTQMPSFRPLSTLRPCRIRDGIRSSVTTAWPSAASVQASMIGEHERLDQADAGQDADADERTGDDRQRQADAEQARPARSTPCAERRSEIREASANRTERQRRLRQQLDRLAADLEIDETEHRAGQQTPPT